MNGASYEPELKDNDKVIGYNSLALKLVTGSQKLADVFVTRQLQGNDREIGDNKPAFLFLRSLQYNTVLRQLCSQGQT